MAAKDVGVKKLTRLRIKKRTSQGLHGKPKNKHARKGWKRYVGQGRPR